MARIAVGGFHHETNCFVDGEDGLRLLRQPSRPPAAGARQGRDRVAGRHQLRAVGFPARHERPARDRAAAVDQRRRRRARHGGCLSSASRASWSGGCRRRCRSTRVYLDLHGAMVSEPFEDGEGELLRRVRAAVGPRVPIAISLDYHSNVTPEMVELTDSLVAYRTYPHVDRPETGQFAARAMSAAARARPPGRARAAQAAVPDPAQRPVHAGRAVEERGRPLGGGRGRAGQSLLPRRLPALRPLLVRAGRDRPCLEPGRGRPRRRRAAARDRAARARVRRADGVARRRRARGHGASRAPPRGRWCFATRRTIPGCGATADTTGVLEALVALGAEGAVVGYLCDAEAAAAAHAAGRGADIAHRARRALGARRREAASRARFRVARLGNGKMRTTGPVSGGREIDLGPMALLTHRRRRRGRDEQAHAGARPGAVPASGRRAQRSRRSSALKSTCHFRAEFEPIAEKVIVVIAPGCYLADPARIPIGGCAPACGCARSGLSSRRPPQRLTITLPMKPLARPAREPWRFARAADLGAG